MDRESVSLAAKVGKLWENGEYVGWKIGKPWWKNHGPHEPIEISVKGSPLIVCEVCKCGLGLEMYKKEDVLKTPYIATLALSGDGVITYAFKKMASLRHKKLAKAELGKEIISALPGGFVYTIEDNSPELKALITYRAELVYILRCNSYYKIGHTRRLGSRIEVLQIGNPYEISLVFAVTTLRYKELEKALHSKYFSKNKRGEWFELNDDDVEGLPSFALSFLKNEKTD